MRTVGVLVAVALAIALQTFFSRLVVNGTAAVDLVLVVVVYVALSAGPGAAMVTGSLAGLVQDALSSGVIGMGALAKSTVGFFAGVFGQQFIVTASLPRVVMFLAATLVHAGVFMGLYALLGLRTFPTPWMGVAGQAVGNAVIGMVAFTIIEALPGVVERRRAARRTRH
ncbi:MAG: rod shape-determining protein MreD [Vicinamibacterales bacterium]|nr:rod shape-determining protein MreD [Acidobacteriota bacterium]